MSVAIRSYAKINLGLKIGAARADGFHELRTIYQTIALHDIVRVELSEGEGIEIRCEDARVPPDATNTCWKVAERVLALIPRGLKSARDLRKGDGSGAAEAAPLRKPVLEGPLGRIVITIEKRLPVQGGMGGASSNAVATMLGLERALGVEIAPQDKLRIAAEVGSDLTLFLIGGTVLGVDRGQEVYPLPDLPEIPLAVVTPSVGVSTPQAFARWDALLNLADTDEALSLASYGMANSALTVPNVTGKIKEFDQAVYAWWSKGFLSQSSSAKVPASGVPATGGDRAETPLLDLVQTGIENDFERVVFPDYPELREVKKVLQREGARYASLSGSGSTLYGLFDSPDSAEAAAVRIRAAGYPAVATKTVGRAEYWKQLATSN